MKKGILAISIFLLLFGLSGCLSDEAKDIKKDTNTQEVVEEENVSNIEKAYNNLTYSKILGENKSKDIIFNNLNFIENIENCTVKWEVYSPYLKSNGEIIRPLSNQNDKKVYAKALIKESNKSIEKVFNFTIMKSSGEKEDKVLLDYYDLGETELAMANSDLNNIVYDLNLPKKAPNGSEIIWNIGNSEYISEGGKVKRPSENESDKNIKIKANFNLDGIKKEKEFGVTVKKKSSNPADAVELSRRSLTNYIVKGENSSLKNVNEDLNLITDGIDNTTITWESENENLILEDGTVNFKNALKETNIKLTAWITVKNQKGSISRNREEIESNDASILSKKTFTVTIPKYDAPAPPGAPIIERKGTLIIINSSEDVYYTLDGSDPTDPTNPNRILYTEPIELSDACQLQAVSYDGTSYSGTFSDFYSREELGIGDPIQPGDVEDIITVKVTDPTMDPTGFTSLVPLPVTITTPTPGANIYYTTDGSTPTSSDNLYSGSITVSSTMTIKAIAIKQGYKNSDVVTGNFTILEPPAVSNPVFSPDEGSYTTGSGITITMDTSTVGADIYYEYTTDGTNPTDPTTGSTNFGVSGGIDVSTLPDSITLTIKAVAMKSGYDNSEIVSAVYKIENNPTIASVEISPSGDLTLEKDSTQTFTAVAKDSTGNIINGAGTFTYSVDSGVGSINGTTGVYTASATGSAVVLVTEDGGETATSGAITVIDSSTADSYTYNGTTYTGLASGGSGSPETYADANITITEPTVATFDADGFFRLKGSVTYTGAEQYTWVRVIKGGPNDSDNDYNDSTNTTTHWLNGTFDERIWLRFGSGTYTVQVIKATITTGNTIVDPYDGDINGWSYTLPARYTFTVNNTRNEDGRYIYPSHYIQSDNTEIANKASEIVASAGASTNYEKAEAIHDWVVKYLYYDDDSLDAGKRKKQDAVTTYTSATNVGSLTNPATAVAVCEGYTSLYNAMLRSQGVKVKAIAGDANGGPHAWSAVENNTGSGYMYVDTTWDDPGPNDAQLSNLYKTWFWKNTLDNHNPEFERPQRTLSRDIEDTEERVFEGSDFYRYSY